MGFVLSGMNGGALVAPFVAGAIYDHAGYYAVWGLCLGIVGFDFILRITMIEKSKARKWLNPQAMDARETLSAPPPIPDAETDPLLPADRDISASSITIYTKELQATCDTLYTNVSDWPAADLQQPRKSWFVKTFPAMTTLLRSPRILAAVYGCFTHTMLISSFDAVLAIFVKRIFSWSSTGAGLIFLAITIPSTLGAVIGALSDRYGTRTVAVFGFALTVVSLALLGVVTDGSVPHQIALIILLVANGKLVTA